MFKWCLSQTIKNSEIRVKMWTAYESQIKTKYAKLEREEDNTPNRLKTQRCKVENISGLFIQSPSQYNKKKTKVKMYKTE